MFVCVCARGCARRGQCADGLCLRRAGSAEAEGECRHAAGCEQKCGVLRGGGGGVDWRSLVSVSTRQECVSVRSRCEILLDSATLGQVREVHLRVIGEGSLLESPTWRMEPSLLS